MIDKKQATLSDQDEKDMNDAVNESANDQVAAEEIPADVEQKAVAVRQQSTALTNHGFGIPIEGMQDVPASMLPVPFVKLVQGSSQKIELENGEDAPQGTFYFTDLQQAFKELSFVMLRVKHQIKEFEREEHGQTVLKPTKQLLILGITLETQKLFILTLSVMSFSNFGRLIAKFKELNVSAAWQYEIVASSEKTENKKGKFWIADFKIGKKLTEEEIDRMAATYGEYGGVLDREDIQEQDVDTE